MKTPESLETLVESGIIQEVVRPLMSGKEAQIYVVVVDGEECVAKVYKEAHQRTFKHRAAYTEGRGTRNSRDKRAVGKRTRHGRKQDEAAWRNTEVDMIYRLREAGVRVPEPINFMDGVLVMELVKDGEGDPAPRLGDLSFEPAEATAIYQKLIREVARMLCGGVVHGDLSVFNVLMGADGPVVIDFPQAVDPAKNQSARKLLIRDVENLHRFLARYAPDHPRRAYAEEIWSLYESNRLRPDTQLSGDYRAPEGKASTAEVLALIEDANLDEQIRRHGFRREVPESPAGAPKPLRVVVDFTQEAKSRPASSKRPTERAGAKGGARSAGRRKGAAQKRVATNASVSSDAAAPKKRSRRRRKGRAKVGAEAAAPDSRGEGAAPKARGEAAAPRSRSEGAGAKTARKSGEPKSATGRRRGGRSGRRSKSEAPGSVARPNERGTGSRGAGESSSPAGGSKPPSRRRRRRPRATDE